MTTPDRLIPELLAPAGDFEAMRAAVSNGADAVYFGLGDFNARHRATNFSLEELPATLQYLHEHGVRGYVTFNTLVFSDELPRAEEFLTAIIEAGADAVIVQDLGIVRLIKRLCGEFPVHGSTQMTLTEPRGIEFVRQLGVERVILARELSTREIGRITASTTTPVEVFVHGALCVAYSGQCLTSESFGGRSANRGQCAQACRQPYELIVDGRLRDLGDKAYLLSPQDLAAFDLIDNLAQLGVCSVKIEGRLKSAHYVAATTQTYRAALDASSAGTAFAPTQQQQLDLAQSFSRGFTHGFLDGVNHQELVQGRFPKSRGVRLGTVVEVTAQGVLLELDPQFTESLTIATTRAGSSTSSPMLPVKPGDGVVFDEGHPEQDEQGGRVFAVNLRTSTQAPRSNAVAANRSAKRSIPPRQKSVARATGSHEPQLLVEITFGRGHVNLAAVSRGATVWKTDDPALRRRLEKSFADGSAPAHRARLHVSVRGRAGERLEVMARDEDGHAVRVLTDESLSAALKHPLSESLIREQFGRLGDTPFELGDVELRDDNGPVDQLPVMAPKSVLNELRRRTVQALLAERRAANRAGQVHRAALDELRREIPRVTAPPETVAPSGDDATAAVPQWSVLARNLAQVEAILDWRPAAALSQPALIYCDFEEVRLSRRAVEICRAAERRVALATPRVIKPGEEGLLNQLAVCAPDAILVRNLAALGFFGERYPQLDLIGDYALNVANELTADLFANQGLQRLVPSYDLNLQQLQAMLKRVDPGLFEVVLHQHMPMFHMEHCVFSHTLSNGKDFHDCGRPCDRHRVDLRDHVGAAHPLVADVGCRNTVFNGHAQSAAPFMPKLRAWGVRHFRVELLRESATETHRLLETYARVVAGLDQGPGPLRQLHVLNQLGVTSGTLSFD